MARFDIELDTFKVHDKNEWSKDEAYLWCFGLVVDNNTLSSKNYIIKKKPDQGNLGKGFKKGESRKIPETVGRISSTITPINLGSKNMALVGLLILAWEEDNTPNSKVVQAYNDSEKVLKEHIEDRIRMLNTGPLTQTEIDAIVANLKKAIEKRFKSAVNWYNPFSWDPDDFIGFAQEVEVIEDGRTFDKAISFTFKGDDAKYEVKGRMSVKP
jgi:hypothetical protein